MSSGRDVSINVGEPQHGYSKRNVGTVVRTREPDDTNFLSDSSVRSSFVVTGKIQTMSYIGSEHEPKVHIAMIRGDLVDRRFFGTNNGLIEGPHPRPTNAQIATLLLSSPFYLPLAPSAYFIKKLYDSNPKDYLQLMSHNGFYVIGFVGLAAPILYYTNGNLSHFQLGFILTGANYAAGFTLAMGEKFLTALGNHSQITRQIGKFISAIPGAPLALVTSGVIKTVRETVRAVEEDTTRGWDNTGRINLAARGGLVLVTSYLGWMASESVATLVSAQIADCIPVEISKPALRAAVASWAAAASAILVNKQIGRFANNCSSFFSRKYQAFKDKVLDESMSKTLVGRNVMI